MTVPVRSRIILVSLGALALSACAGAAFRSLTAVEQKIDGFTRHYAESYFQIGDRGVFSVELVTTPQRLAAGGSRFDIIVHSAGMDIEGAAVTARLEPAEGDGAAQDARIWEEEYGVYNVTGLEVFGPARWRFRVDASKGKQSDQTEFMLDVPAPPRHR